MIAIAFAYFNYKYSQYKFINFKETILYTKSQIFVPKKERYIVVIYSSHMGSIEKNLANLKQKNSLLVIDLYQQRRESTPNVIYATAGTNTLLKIIHRFHIREVPSYFMIKKQNENGLYKQDSQIYLLD
ncbi:hypothetical protein [Hydrogenimonas thermophila]|uniref:hypothetical protein n=1 Tax=Hydrogenimonas thermophila TaxID=223786 RepID=UPI001FE0BBAB|nr:hypothetical protein [Hydrogenimonas thermophila]WOE69695.1 hypothetical protein RZR91_11380 [Hydrogenimonas thermophila]WOE72209.1 hypothetical protein RZR97_11370 [Hydrogenimonas thermophila]